MITNIPEGSEATLALKVGTGLIAQGHPERVVTAMVFTDIPTMESWMVANGFDPLDYPAQ